MRVITRHAASQGARLEQQDAWQQTVRKDGAFAVLVVCDGVGGEDGGRECAQLAAHAALNHLSVFRRQRKHALRLLHRLPRAVGGALDRAVLDGSVLEGAATSLAAVVIDDKYAWVVTVGDCRATLIRNGEVLESSTPHNRAYDDADGVIEAGASRSERLAQLTRHIGAGPSSPVYPATVLGWSLLAGDVVAVTSDGVHEALGLRALAEVLSAEPRDQGVETAIARAEQRAAPDADNGTILCAYIDGSGRRAA